MAKQDKDGWAPFTQPLYKGKWYERFIFWRRRYVKGTYKQVGNTVTYRINIPNTEATKKGSATWNYPNK